MSTVVEERSQSGFGDFAGRLSLEPLLAWRPRLTVQSGAYLAIFLVAFGLRFWDLGARAMHHDESLHATYSYYLYDGRGYVHHPLMHGPLLFHLMALVYLLFGVSDATARFAPAAFGAAMVLLPLLLRPWLGRVGAVAAAALLALSPTILYFSRFVGAGAQDIIVSVAMLVMVAGVWHHLRDGATRWLYIVAAGLAIGFTTKEVTYIHAAILVLYLDGVAAADLAEQAGAEREWSVRRRQLAVVAFMPVAWALVLFWPSMEGMRERLRLTRFPRAGGMLIVIGTLSAPFFSAASQVLLERLGVKMEARAPFGDWTNEQFWGALTIGGLLALGAYFGCGWNRRLWLISAAIFWGISIPLFTTFFTNIDGIATGIWGSLDYWLQQQDVRRGTQPVFYYLILTPVYEYVTLGLAFAGILYRAIRTGWDTTLAALAALALCLVGAVAGDGAHATLPFAVVALFAATYAMRGRAFQQFLVFWLGAMLVGLSAAGEKMPWLEVHLALPLALLAALTLDEASRAVTGLTLPAWLRPVAAFGAWGVVAAVLALASDRFAWANPALLVVCVSGAGAALALALRRHPAAGLAAAALFVGFLGPLSVRAAAVAAYEHGDTPVEMLVYTQSTPELHAIKKQIDQYARDSGMGLNLPITVDATEAFTWPWAWYLRDYKNVGYPELGSYRNNATLLNTLPAGGVLLAESANADIGLMRSDIYGPGIPYKHRWWFPEEYRSATTEKFFDWIRDPAELKKWANYFLHRVPPAPLGSIDAVAYFPSGHGPADASAAPEPRVDATGRLVAGEPGAGKGQFRRPAGVAVDPAGNVYVADSLNNRIQKLGPDGRLLATLGGGQIFHEPWGVAVDRDGNLYVADTWNHRIQKFDRDLNFVKAWGEPVRQAGSPNTSPLELYGPRDIVVDFAGNLWVTDTGNSRVIKYSPDGQPLGTFGGPGVGPGQFQEPVGIALAPNGDLLVTDAWNGRVQRFDASFGYKGEFRVEAWTDRGPESKPYLAVAPDGTLYVAVPETGTVLYYGADGRPLGIFATFDNGAGGRGRPLGIAVDGAGSVWVADGAGGTVSRLSPR